MLKRRLAAIRVLVLVDDPVQAELVDMKLHRGAELAAQEGDQAEAADVDVRSVPHLADAITILAEGGVEAVLTALDVADSRGLDTVVRLHRAAPEVPLIVLTDATNRSMAERALSVGASDYLSTSDQNPMNLLKAVQLSQLRPAR